MLSEDVLNEEMTEAVFMCNMLYSRASGRVSGTAPHPCACCPPWAGLGSTMYQYPHPPWVALMVQKPVFPEPLH